MRFSSSLAVLAVDTMSAAAMVVRSVGKPPIVKLGTSTFDLFAEAASSIPGEFGTVVIDGRISTTGATLATAQRLVQAKLLPQFRPVDVLHHMARRERFRGIHSQMQAAGWWLTGTGLAYLLLVAPDRTSVGGTRPMPTPRPDSGEISCRRPCDQP